MSGPSLSWQAHAYKRRYVLIAIVVLTLAAAVAYALVTRPNYKSEALLAPAKGLQDNGGGMMSLTQRLGSAADLLGMSLPQPDLMRLSAVLTSREFTEKVLRAGLLQHVYPAKWDATSRRWKGEPPSMEQAAQLFDVLRTVSVDRQTNLIKVSLIAPTPEQARDDLGLMIQILNDSERARALYLANQNLIYLKDALATETNSNLRDALSRIVQSQLATQMLAKSSKDFAVDIIDRPYLPESRNAPKRKLVVLLGGIAGVALAFLYLLIERSLPWLGDYIRRLSNESRLG